MQIRDLVSRAPITQPFDGEAGGKIPWHEPGFSDRMLAEHLSQSHDAASRRAEAIDAHVRFIHDALLRGTPSHVLDLGCGPGLYASELARLGHTCHGVDISPASVAYARDEAAREHLACTYAHEDMREAQIEAGRFDLAMLLFGELNTFVDADVARILGKMCDALAPGGRLLLEPHTFAGVESVGRRPPRWYAAEHGFFSDAPHLRLEECHWHADAAAATRRFFVVDAASGDVTQHAESLRAYTEAEYRDLVVRAGFTDVAFEPSLAGSADGVEGLCVVTARRANGGAP